MYLFVHGLGLLSNKDVKLAMLIKDIYISKLMTYVKQVQKDKLKNQEEFHGLKFRISANELSQPRLENGNLSFFQKRSIKLAPPSTSMTSPKHKYDQNYKIHASDSQNSVVKGFKIYLL